MCDKIMNMPKILATDLDGTLFYPKKLFTIVDKKTIRFLREFIDQGNHFCLVSGRNIQVAKKVQKVLKRNVDMVACNGAIIKLNDELIKKEHFNNNHLKELIDFVYSKYKLAGFLLMSENHCLVMDTKRSTKTMKNLYWIYRLMQGRRADKIKINGKIFDEEVKNGKVYKLMLFIGIKKSKIALAKEMNKELREKYSDEFECAWSDEVIEISPKNSHKAQALCEYADKLGINKDDVYVVGDSGNDISMFNEFHEHSYCMSHASPTVIKYAKHVIKRVYNIKDDLLEEGE